MGIQVVFMLMVVFGRCCHWRAVNYIVVDCGAGGKREMVYVRVVPLVLFRFTFPLKFRKWDSGTQHHILATFLESVYSRITRPRYYVH